MGIKARVYNQIRKDLYKKRLENISDQQKVEFFNVWYGLNLLAHNELNNYKQKRKDKAELLKIRQASPQTKSMMKKLGLLPKKKNLADSK